MLKFKYFSCGPFISVAHILSTIHIFSSAKVEFKNGNAMLARVCVLFK